MDISPITPTFPVQKPAKIKNDREQSNSKQQQPKPKESPEQQDDDETVTHIDEIV